MTRPPPEHEDLKDVRLLLLDVDGVLTDGRLTFGADGHRSKCFHVRDGMGLSLLRDAGVATGIISGRDDPFVRRRAEDLGIDRIRLGVRDKGIEIDRLTADLGLDPVRVAFVGDDVNDVPALRRVGIPIAVADAHPAILEFVRFQTLCRGGEGAVREVADAILGPAAAGPFLAGDPP